MANKILSPRVIFIGASAGGVTAIRELLQALPKMFSPPIVVVQHLPASSNIDVGLIFGPCFGGRVQEAIDKLPIEPGNAYFAPAGYHLLVERDQTLALTQDEMISHSRPSIDVLFESAAESLGNRAIGILLTGASDDGARGMAYLKLCGATTIVQDPETAEYATMPQSALNLVQPNFVMNLGEISQYLSDLQDRVTN